MRAQCVCSRAETTALYKSDQRFVVVAVVVLATFNTSIFKRTRHASQVKTILPCVCFCVCFGVCVFFFFVCVCFCCCWLLFFVLFYFVLLLFMTKSQDSVHKPEVKAEPKRFRTEVPLLTSLTPYR